MQMQMCLLDADVPHLMNTDEVDVAAANTIWAILLNCYLATLPLRVLIFILA